MNILVLSDSHGNISNMEEAVEREKPDMILHLGDCWRDAERLAERYPDIPMEHGQSLRIELTLVCGEGVRYQIRSWYVYDSGQYEIDNSMPVWDGAAGT